ncbi:MAG: asparagine synthase (glutamine-hydrolyzing) [Acidobacteriota bacterium]|nr:asparagine synthase (glutamine-hydrolyzing) [Acidobacteriota bacterium]
MCGIAGLVREGGVAPGDNEALDRMLAAQFKRGPDGDGVFRGTEAVLGHRRLSIIDLSPLGKQPMPNEDESLWVTFNGEIYNHQELRAELVKAGHVFRSRTDTEVLLHGYEQWGMAGLLGRLRGMFAFALYDVGRGLMLARDRLGIKPLYYYAGGGLLIFASEVKALLEGGLISAERDRNALAGFLIAGAVPAPLTTIKGVRCLEAGYWAEWKDGTLSIRKYWDLGATSSGDSLPHPAELKVTLEDTVRRHLISDVPLGVFLSGGVDSAGLVALASRLRREEGQSLTTLTVVFDEREFSEAGAAAEIAKHFETSHREIRVTGEDFKRELPAFIASMDQPTNDGVNSYFVSKAAREAGLTVVLSGLGGDEVFLGYKHHRWLRHQELAARCPAPRRYLLAQGGNQWGRWRGRDNWKRTAWLKPAASSDRLYLTMRGFFAPDQVARLMDMNRAELDSAVDEHFGSLQARREASAGAFNYLEMKRYLHDQLLRDTDVFSMAHSIEARVPYLDHVLVDEMWRVAPEWKIEKGINKPLLVRAVDDPAVLRAATAPKRGFTFPMARWMKSSAPEMREIAEAGSLAKGAVQDCWADFSAGRMHWSRAWALTVLGATN